MVQMLPLSIAKIKLSRLIDDVLRREDEVLITRNGKLAAVLLSPDEYACWKETREIKANPALMREIRKGLKALQQGQGKKYHSLDELFE